MDLGNGFIVHNLYAVMQDTFENVWVVIFYVIACISLGYHLAHGFQSAFNTETLQRTAFFDRPLLLIVMSTLTALASVATFAGLASGSRTTTS